MRCFREDFDRYEFRAIFLVSYIKKITKHTLIKIRLH